MTRINAAELVQPSQQLRDVTAKWFGNPEHSSAKKLRIIDPSVNTLTAESYQETPREHHTIEQGALAHKLEPSNESRITKIGLLMPCWALVQVHGVLNPTRGTI